MTQPPVASGPSSQPIRLAVWSGPRNISTALMRSWENRPDCVVVDEPLYAAYLAATGADHPGRDEVLAAGPTDWRLAVERLHEPLPAGIRVHYAKHMSHHLLPEMGTAWVSEFRTVLLVRDPRRVVASYLRSRSTVEPADIGVRQQETLLEVLRAHGQEPPVIDADDFLRRPAAHLEWWCDWLGLPFTEAMLRWPAGSRDSDGVWAPHWYAAVRASTGFSAWRPAEVTLAPEHAAVAEACRPAYERLRALRVRI